MKRLMLPLIIMFAMAGWALADEYSHGQVHVWLNVNPNMSVQPLDPTIDLGDIQTGTIFGYIPYRIDANTQTIMLWAATSNLYKGNDPGNPEVPPIGVLMPAGVEFDAQYGNPTNGEDNVADYVGAFDLDGFPGYVTEQIEFESSQSGHFSQEVSSTMGWEQLDPERPMGEYSGNVQLWAMIVLP